MIKVLVIDDEPMQRQGIVQLTPWKDFGAEVVGAAGSGMEGILMAREHRPDVLIVDIKMPGLTGLDVTKQLKQARSRVKIIALTIHDSDNYVLEMLKNGALGYLLKDVEPNVLIKAIHMVNEGNPFVYPKLAERLFGTPSISGDVGRMAKEIWDESRGERLTPREMDVLGCIAKGLSNQDIGKALGLSEKTVKNHLTSVFHKLKVNDRTQALVYVLKNKIVSLE